MNDIMKIRNELECPVCTEYMIGEIYLCINGHSICKNCVERVQPNCPICRGLIADRRNFTLENIASALTYPCKNCQVDLNANEIISHELECDTGFFNCNSIFGRCDWSGPYLEAKSHIEKQHKEYIGKWKSLDNFQLYIIFFDCQPFFVFFKFQGELTCYAAIFIGPKKQANNYILNVSFDDQTNKGYKLSGSSPCVSICKVGQVFQREKIIFSYDMMGHFLGNSKYHSTLTITNKNGNGNGNGKNEGLEKDNSRLPV